MASLAKMPTWKIIEELKTRIDIVAIEEPTRTVIIYKDARGDKLELAGTQKARDNQEASYLYLHTRTAESGS
jgi:hypothetical protein